MSNLATFAGILARSGAARGDIPVLVSTISTRGFSSVCRRGKVVATFGRTNFGATFFSGRHCGGSFVSFFKGRTSRYSFVGRSSLATNRGLSSSCLLTLIRRRLTGKGHGRFVILRACKSRFGCQRHCPTRTTFFRPSDPTSTRFGCQSGLVGTCSGSVHCASSFLSELVNLLRRRSTKSTVLCASSRKRSVFSSRHHLFLRTSPIPSCCRLRMPFVI